MKGSKVLDRVFDHLIWEQMVSSERSQSLLWHSSKACQEPSTWAERHCWSQQSLPQHDALATWTHDLGFDTICWIGSLTISSENQLVSSEGSQSLLWHSNRTLHGMSRAVHEARQHFDPNKKHQPNLLRPKFERMKGKTLEFGYITTKIYQHD